MILFILNTFKFIISKPIYRMNFKDLKIDVLASLPKLDIKAKYKLNFKLFGSDIQSEGDYFTIYDNSKVRLTLQGQRFIQNGKEYAKFDAVPVRFKRGFVSELQMTNLFGGRSEFSKSVQELIREDQEFYNQHINPHIEDILSKTFTKIANAVIEGSSVDELFPN